MTDIAIIGAGLSGLTAANLLKNDCNVTVFEKARGVSGRISTRRADQHSFDHGAQYFTARTDAFKEFILPLLDAGVIQRWNADHCNIDGRNVVSRQSWGDGEPRYVGVPSMNAIGRYLAKDIEISLKTRVCRLKREEKWQVIGEDDEVLGEFDWVISTAPAPQTAQLFPDMFKYKAELSAVQMLPCFAVMLGFEEDIDLGFAAAHIENSDLSWIANNASKPERSSRSTIMIHSSHQFAQSNLETDRAKVMQTLIDEASKVVGVHLANASFKTIHRWLYANNARRCKGPLMLDTDLKLGACGDWNMGGRIEGAFVSTHRLVDAIRKQIQ